METVDKFYKNKKSGSIWWVDNNGALGEFLFSFDKKKIFNLFRDYPAKLTLPRKQYLIKKTHNGRTFSRIETEKNNL